MSLNPYQIQQILERTTWSPIFVPATKRGWWEGRRARMEPGLIDEIVSQAEGALEESPAFLPMTEYLAFRDTGDRRGYEALLHQRGWNLGALTMAHCLTGDDRYLGQIQNYLWAILEQATWVYPAHANGLPDPARPSIDLNAAMTALSLTDIVQLVGDRLEPGLLRKLRWELDVRVWTPYLERNDFHWQGASLDRGINNWTAVCTAGVLGSAIAMEMEPERLARIVDRGLRSLDEYIATFDIDGGSSEGPGYWDYGFGYFAIIAQLLAHRTQGRIDLFEHEQVGKIAVFPLRTQLSPGRYVTFSDCNLDVQMEPGLLELLAARLDLPALRGLGGESRRPRGGVYAISWLVRDTHWRTFEPVPAAPPEESTWYRGLQWMISRGAANGLVLAIKGGHNRELHNQNDVGSLIVAVGDETILTDPGRGVYTRQYFGPERYTFLVNNSMGHSVPVVNGHLQGTGEAFAALVLAQSFDSGVDTLTLDLAAAYPPEAGAVRIVREARYQRKAGTIDLIDTFTLREDAGTAFESALITLHDVAIGDGEVIVTAARHRLRIAFDAAKVTAWIDAHEGVELWDAPTTVRRIVFSLREPAREGTIALGIGVAS
jgi:hypothetical protein